MDASPTGTHGAVDGGRLVVERLETLEQVEALAPEWDRLARSRDNWLPFLGPVWNLTWWEHLAERSVLLSDRFWVHAVRRAGGELVGVAPLMLTERPSRGPLRVRMLQFFGADPAITEARAVACTEENEAPVYRALRDHLVAHADDWDLMKWSSVREEGPGHSLLTQTSDVALLQVGSNFVLDLPSSWEELKQRGSRNLKESLRKCYNSLKREGHEFEFRVLDGREALAEGLERFFRMHGLRAVQKDTVVHKDVFQSSVSRAFLRDYFRRSPPGSALIFELVIGGHVVATRIGFRHEGSLYLYYSGYVPDWGRFSVMTTLLAETIQWGISQRLTRVNLSFGSDVSKMRWRPREVAFREARWSSPSPRGRFLRSVFGHINALRPHEHWGVAARLLIDQLGTRTSALPSDRRE